jgi:putative RNA 2'-phosphotransferase
MTEVSQELLHEVLRRLHQRNDKSDLAIRDLRSECWADYSELSRKVCERFGIIDADIQRVIAENPKKRFTLVGDRIRAAQGHSVEVDLGLKPQSPPDILYHGTTAKSWDAVSTLGLKPMNRTHVHLSPDIETARTVAIRRKGPHALLKVDSRAMQTAGYAFFAADNGVWLTHEVPPDYLSAVTETNQ